MAQALFENDYDTPPAPDVLISTEDRHLSISIADVTHVVIQ